MIIKACFEHAAAAFDIRNKAILSQCTSAYDVQSMLKWTEGEMPLAFAEKLAADGYVYIHQGQPVATGMIDLEHGFIDAIFVLPEYMRKGIGFEMLTHLEALARQVNLKSLTLESTLNAADFYRSCGFVGEGVSVYHSPRGFDLDCVLMTKSLKPEILS